MTISGYTTNYRLRKLTFASRGWHTDEWHNLDVIDGLIAQLEENNELNFTSTVAGTGDAITLDFTPNIAYTAGTRIAFVVAANNTGAVTINADGLGVKDVKRSSGAALEAGDFLTGQFVRAIYDGTNFLVLYPDLDTISALNNINSGDSGATADTSADDFTVESAASGGMSILVPNGQQARMIFGHVSTPLAGGWHYDTTNGRMYARAGDAEGAYFDSNKVLFQPDLPAFTAYKTWAASTIALAAIITTWTETLDSGADFDASAGTFTVPFTGRYVLYAQAVIADSGNGTLGTVLRFYVNGTVAGASFRADPSTSDESTTVGGMSILSLTAGDVVTLRFSNGSQAGGNFDLDINWSGFFLG